jgi:copper homeostasis protein
MLLEVAVATLEDARTAHAAGADRLELCAALELGGVTPPLGALIEIKRAVPLPVMVMIRPRPGHFTYSAGEFHTLRRDGDLALAEGADGLVFGCLAADRAIDLDQTAQLLRQTGLKQSVFHRAFDVTADPLASLDALIDLGVTRVLTSGQQPTAPAGAALIRQLITRAAGRIEILPGAGVTPENAAALLAQTGATQLHGTFSTATGGDPSTVYRITDATKVRAVRAILSRPRAAELS